MKTLSATWRVIKFSVKYFIYRVEREREQFEIDNNPYLMPLEKLRELCGGESEIQA